MIVHIWRSFVLAVAISSCLYIWAHSEVCHGLPCNPSVKEVELFMSSPAYKAELEKRLAEHH